MHPLKQSLLDVMQTLERIKRINQELEKAHAYRTGLIVSHLEETVRSIDELYPPDEIREYTDTGDMLDLLFTIRDRTNDLINQLNPS